jgi:uncharacterized protein (TIGR01244 family)
MTDFRDVTDDFSVSPQIAPEDVATAAAQGFVLIINNRPDGEQPGQPTSAQIEAQAKANGLAYAHIPFAGRPTAEQAKAVRDLAAAAEGKVLAFCRSGTRSITAWSIGQALSGDRDRGELLSLGAEAGYDLSGALGG